jgi:hypothetical protein
MFEIICKWLQWSIDKTNEKLSKLLVKWFTANAANAPKEFKNGWSSDYKLKY